MRKRQSAGIGTDTGDDSAGGAASRVVVVGSGFAGFHAARALERKLPPQAQITLVSPSDYLLYSPLLPEVSAGVIEPRHIAVSLAQTLRRTTPVLGFTVGVDLAALRRDSEDLRDRLFAAGGATLGGWAPDLSKRRVSAGRVSE